MSEIAFNGGDLLKVFDDLNINLGNLNPNVVHAWFDTDCRKTKNLLDWMCSSLTNENCLTPQEALEWSQIESPLNDLELERNVEEIAREYPGIFDNDTNRFDNEILKEEMEIVEMEKKHYDWELSINMNIDRNLLATETNLNNRLDRVRNDKREMEKECFEASRNLDESHEKLYKQISLFINNYTFKTDQLLHNFNIDVIENNYQETINLINNLYNDGNLIEFDNSDNIQKFSEISQRIFESKLKLYHQEMTESGLNHVLNLMDCGQFKITDERILQLGINKKENMKEILIKDLENLVQKDVDNLVLQPKLLEAKNNLTTIQAKNQQLKKIEQILDIILMYFVELSILYKLDNENIENMEELFTNLWNYINEDLENCHRRIQLLENIQEKFVLFKLNYKPKIADNLAKILDCDADNLVEIAKKSESISKQINKLEKKLFVDRLESGKNSAKNSFSEMKTLKLKIFSGPTSRIEIISLPLQIVFKEIDSNRKRREDGLGIVINDYKEVSRLLSDKDGQNRRQLWMNFLENPHKLSIIIQQQIQ